MQLLCKLLSLYMITPIFIDAFISFINFFEIIYIRNDEQSKFFVERTQNLCQ